MKLIKKIYLTASFTINKMGKLDREIQQVEFFRHINKLIFNPSCQKFSDINIPLPKNQISFSFFYVDEFGIFSIIVSCYIRPYSITDISKNVAHTVIF